jgi:hypothetical protein
MEDPATGQYLDSAFVSSRPVSGAVKDEGPRRHDPPQERPT